MLWSPEPHLVLLITQPDHSPQENGSEEEEVEEEIVNSSAIELKSISEFNNHVCHSLKNIHCKVRLVVIF